MSLLGGRDCENGSKACTRKWYSDGIDDAKSESEQRDLHHLIKQIGEESRTSYPGHGCGSMWNAEPSVEEWLNLSEVVCGAECCEIPFADDG